MPSNPKPTYLKYLLCIYLLALVACILINVDMFNFR